MPLDPDNPEQTGPAAPDWRQALRDHPRSWQDNRYVYPVLSRRARGISVGINLSPDQVCNFQCVYCQVPRRQGAPAVGVDLDVLRRELNEMLAEIVSKRAFHVERFASAPPAMRRVSDIAFSGDGEPTASPVFAQAARIVVAARREHDLPADMKIVVITNATLLDRPAVAEALDLLHEHGGEIWAKLDAGTQDHYEHMNRCPIPLRKILDNVALAAKRWRVVIQSMWLRVDGHDPADSQVLEFADRLREILDAAGQIRAVQIYTLARQPAESYVTALPEDRLRRIAGVVADRTGLLVDIFPSPQ